MKHKEVICSRMALSLFTLFCFGTNAILGLNTPAKQDSWFALIVGFIAFLPMAFVYARAIKLYPGRNILDVCEIVYGKVIGKFFQAMFLIFTLMLAALAMRNTYEFINIIMLRETPYLAIMMTLILMAVYLAVNGIEVLGRWSLAVFVVTIASLLFTFLFSMENMDIDNMRPILNNDITTLLDSAFAMFSFPLAETIVFLLIIDFLDKKTSPYKFFYLGGFISLAVLLLVFFRNRLTLGEFSDMATFPSYVASRLIAISMYFSRVEGLITTNFILLGFLKMSICTLAASEGFSKLFGVSHRRKLAFPVGLLVMALSGIVHENVIQMFQFIDYYRIYALPFEVIVPLIIWIGAEVKTRFGKNSENKPGTQQEPKGEAQEEQSKDEVPEHAGSQVAEDAGEISPSTVEADAENSQGG